MSVLEVTQGSGVAPALGLLEFGDDNGGWYPEDLGCLALTTLLPQCPAKGLRTHPTAPWPLQPPASEVSPGSVCGLSPTSGPAWPWWLPNCPRRPPVTSVPKGTCRGEDPALPPPPVRTALCAAPLCPSILRSPRRQPGYSKLHSESVPTLSLATQTPN